MEDTLGDKFVGMQDGRTRLNPCSNGRHSRSTQELSQLKSLRGLNPCSNGRYSRRKTELLKSKGISQS